MRSLKKEVAANYFDRFSIQFAGLADGMHRFVFDIDDDFFASLEYAVVERGNVNVIIDLDKKPSMIVLSLEFKGTVEVNCDRCTVAYAYPVNGTERLIIQMGAEESGDEDLIVLPKGAFEFNIAQHIYEYIALSLPLRVVPCEETGNTELCDKDIIQKLEQMLLNDDDKPVDPRWEKLKNLNTNSN
ncbi:MAG: YceD family protein [Bacteroidia bacterium]